MHPWGGPFSGNGSLTQSSPRWPFWMVLPQPGILDRQLAPELAQSEALLGVWILDQKQRRPRGQGTLGSSRMGCSQGSAAKLPQSLGPSPSNKVLFWDLARRSWFLCLQPGEAQPPTNHTFIGERDSYPVLMGSEARLLRHFLKTRVQCF